MLIAPFAIAGHTPTGLWAVWPPGGRPEETLNRRTLTDSGQSLPAVWRHLQPETVHVEAPQTTALRGVWGSVGDLAAFCRAQGVAIASARDAPC